MAITATLARTLIALNGASGPEWGQAEDATIYPCTLISKGTGGDTKKYVINASSTPSKPVGVADCDDDHDLNTAYALGESVPYWKLGSGVTIYLLYDDGTNSSTLYQEDTLIASNNEDGACEKWSYSTKGATYASTSFTELSDAPFNYRIGKVSREVTITAQSFIAVDLI
jgi:hypothetical protein